MHAKFQAVMEKKNLLESKKPIPQDKLEEIKEKVWLEWIYNSVALDGNTLTRDEIKDLVDGKNSEEELTREQQEVLNHKEAAEYVEKIAEDDGPLVEEQIKEINRILLKNISKKFQGLYKNHEDIVAGDDRTHLMYGTVEEDMQKLMIWYEDNRDEYNVLELSAYMHGTFLGISPFAADNGKTARFMITLELMKGGYPPIIIKKEDNVRYRNSLERAYKSGDYEHFLQFVLSEVERSLDLYLENI